jgi:hypothetical protein
MQRALMTISSFRFAISVHPAPEPPLAIDSDDERLEFVHAVAKHLDGAIFTPSGLRDASGRIMIHATLPPHPDAVPPALSIEAPHPSMMPRYWGGTLPNPPSPSPQRVALRTLCLLAASYRAMLEREQDTPERLRAAHVDFLEWVNAVGLKAELEPEELGLLTALIGSGNARRFMNADWLIEGAAILAWALRKLEWPAYDSQVDVALMGKTCGLSSPEQAREFLKTPVLRDHADIERRTTQLLALHWRLRELRLHPGRKDFQTWSQNAWFGKMPLEGIRFLAGDLAIGTTPISQAPASLLMPLELSIQERHRALNWLCGAHELYSKTDTPT